MLREVKIVAVDVPGERLVWAEVELPPVCYPDKHESSLLR
jgi:hypothetical protein